jgi:signal transduction histidine kinase
MNLRPIIRGIIDEIRAAHPSREINLHCPLSVEGAWDRDRLEQVFSNLVSNAVHYGDPNRAVTVEVREEGAEVLVAIHNDGRPIPDELRAELFSPFRRGERDSNTSETAGLGLGLYISRELAVAHGGDLDVRSTAADGTTFRLRLPRLASVSPPI